MKYMISWFERPQGSPLEYENAQKRILEVFRPWKAPANFKIEVFVIRVGEWGGHMLVDCDDPTTVHKFCSMLPAFVFVAATDAVTRRLQHSAAFAAFLKGVVAGALALMVAVAGVLAKGAFVDGWTVAIGVAVAVVLLWRRVNPVWLIAAGALAGALLPGLG